MRFSLVRLKMPTNTKLWQDPVLGYFETHGKMEFIAGEDYGISDEEKKAVLWRYRLKEILKKEYLRREYDPHTFKYREGVVIDPAVFRWYSANAMQYEFFRYTPRSVFLYAGSFFLVFYILVRMMFQFEDRSRDMCLDGELLWWDRARDCFFLYLTIMGTRAVLKTIRQHIDAKEFDKAGKIIEDLLKQDVSDYLLFVFAAITSGEVGDNAQAISYYKKATELDGEKPLAWQGLYKLYEQKKYDDLEHVLIIIKKLLLLPGLTSEKISIYEKELGFILLKLKRFDEAFSNLDLLNDDNFCCEALKIVVRADDWNGNRKELVEKCLIRMDINKLNVKLHQDCAVLRCSWAETLEEIENVLNWHARYISLDDERIIDLLRYLVIISYLERRQIDRLSGVVDMLKNAIKRETEFGILLEHIQKVEMALSIKNIDENLERNACNWPYIGLAIPSLIVQERYEQVLSLLDVVVPQVHPAITRALNKTIFGIRCEALYGIHDDSSLVQLQVLLSDSSGSKRVPRNIRLAVIILICLE
uniref:NADH dehydrogenase [ubiquinone] 1 beta subcomplex subunit 4 n=1 Tax=Setaria digitata TaxID=48799 RepID=A0A915PVM8_9BILA